jgi:hypothetical protein
MDYAEFFEQQVRVQRGNLWLSVGVAFCVLLAGLIGSALWFKVDANAAAQTSDLFKLGPALLSTAISTFPVKQIQVHRIRIATFRSLERHFLGPTASTDPTALQAAQDYFKQTLKID